MSSESTNTLMQRIKVLELADQTLWLLIRINPENGCFNMTQQIDRASIRVQLRSAELDSVLPSGIRLTLLADSGEIVQSIAARDHDNGIQLKRFRCLLGTRFALQVSLNSEHLTEKVIV